MLVEPLTDEPDFRLQQDAEPVIDLLLYVLHERQDIVARGVPEIHDEIGVPMRDLGIADARAF